jgi:hypothetical protein
MDNHSMTWESQFYLNAYCTASRPLPYRKSGAGKQKRYASPLTRAVDSVIRGTARAGFLLMIDSHPLIPDLCTLISVLCPIPRSTI